MAWNSNKPFDLFPLTVVLTDNDIARCIDIAHKQYDSDQTNNRVDPKKEWKRTKQQSIANRTLGNLGERALAIWTRRDQWPGVDQFTRKPDIGGYDVRTRDIRYEYKDWGALQPAALDEWLSFPPSCDDIAFGTSELRLYERDKPSIQILVWRISDNEFYIRGWYKLKSFATLPPEWKIYLQGDPVAYVPHEYLEFPWDLERAS